MMTFDFAASDIAAHDPYADSIPSCFERIADAHPLRLAVGGESWQPTYRELDLAANRIAHAVLAGSSGPGDRVAVVMRHDAPMVAAVLGAIKAGRVAVVLNPGEPPARLKQVLDVAAPATIITDSVNEDVATTIAGDATVLRFETCAAAGSVDRPSLKISSDQPAFIVFSSGSTGRPNGALHIHGAAIATAQTTARMLEIGPADRVLFLSSAGGGQGVGTLFLCMLSGASLWPFLAFEKGVHGLADFLDTCGITSCTWSASIFRHMVMTIGPERCFPAVHSIRMTSEKATLDDFHAFQRHFSDQCTLNYSLASSEAGQIARMSLRRGDTVGDGVLPIGRVHDGVKVELLGEDGRAVPHGEPGELVVTSRSVTIGYWGDPALSAERISVPADSPAHRTLRTRDLVRWNDAGLLEFVGRLNRRVKIRGYTVELVEVDQALRGLPGVKEATATVLERPSREPQLSAFIIPETHAIENGTLQPAKLRRALRALLPRQMVPATFVFLDAFPLNANGKLDRDKLDEMLESRGIREEPRTDTELMLARVWRDIFKLEDIGRQEDFFDLGGDSLSASVVAAWLQGEFGVEIDLGTFMSNPTLETLAAFVDRLRKEDVAGVDRSAVPRRGGPLPLSFSQQFYWQSSRVPGAPTGHTTRGGYRLVGALQTDVFLECLNALHRRHEMLRTTFAETNGEPAQIVREATPVTVQRFDFTGDPDGLKKAEAVFRQEGRRSFDLGKLPLIQFSLIRISDREHHLIYACHHIILDGWSMKMFIGELAALYDARVHEREDPFPPVAARQYGDFAEWQRATFRPDSSMYREMLASLIDDILATSYPDHPAYRRQLVRLIAATGPGRRFRKQVLGFLLRTAWSLPPPPGGAFPGRRPKPAIGVDPALGVIRWGLPLDVTQRLEALGRKAGATYYMVRLAGYAALLSDELGIPRVVFSSQFSKRHRPETRDVFGFCANPMPIILRCDASQPFSEFLASVRDRMVALQALSDFPYDELQREMRAWRIKRPRVSSLLSVSTNSAAFVIEGLEVSELDNFTPASMPSGVDLRFDINNEQDGCALTFDAGFYDPASMQSIVDRLVRFFGAVSRQPDRTLRELSAMP